MHLAYVDDSGNNANRVILYGAFIIPHGEFFRSQSLTGVATEQAYKVLADNFEEFHARDLYHGTKKFEGLSQRIRFEIIEILLMQFTYAPVTFVYSAIDADKVRASIASSVDCKDLAFQLCLLGVEDWARSRGTKHADGFTIEPNEFVLAVVDDNESDKDYRAKLSASFRKLRAKWIPAAANFTKQRLWHFHDAIYFGNSKDSIGLQAADLCAFFMANHLAGTLDDKAHNFIEVITKHAICAKPEPEWSQYRHLLLDHNDQ